MEVKPYTLYAGKIVNLSNHTYTLSNLPKELTLIGNAINEETEDKLISLISTGKSIELKTIMSCIAKDLSPELPHKLNDYYWSSIAPGEGMPMEFSLTAEEMDYLNKHPEMKVEYETNKLREFLDKTRPAQLNQIFPKLESLYQIYRSAPYGLALDKLKEEARNVKQLNATDLNMIKSRPYWPLIKDIVE